MLPEDEMDLFSPFSVKTFVKSMSLSSSSILFSSIVFLGLGRLEKSGGTVSGFFLSIKNSSIPCFFFNERFSFTLVHP